MVIEIDTEQLKRLKVTAHEFLILRMLLDNNLTLLYDYFSYTGSKEEMEKSIQKLEEKGYIEGNTIDLSILANLKLTEKVRKIFAFDVDPFYELYKLYPTKTIRPDGKEVYLRRNYKYCNDLYNNVVRANPIKHRNILEALRKEINDRDLKGTMQYMKTLASWLSDQSWQDYEDTVGPSSQNKPEIYGTDVE